MGLSLDQFADEVRRDIEAFVADYRKKHEENPEHYPLELPDNNAGLCVTTCKRKRSDLQSRRFSTGINCE